MCGWCGVIVRGRRPVAVDLLIGLGVLALVCLNIVPLAWGVLGSFKPPAQLITYPPTLFDFNATLQNYRQMIESGFLIGMRNSTLYGVGAVALALLFGSLAAFGFDRFAFRGHGLMFLVVVASIPLAIGAAALLIPNFLFFTRLGLTNRWFTLPLIYGVHSLPIAIWTIKGAMESVPRKIDDSAYIDGASSFTVLWRVVLPLCAPALAAASLLVFVHSWNEFVAGSVMVDASDLKPIQPLIYQFIGFFGREWGPLTASATLAILPVLLIYALCGRLLISGLTSGATKG